MQTLRDIHQHARYIVPGRGPCLDGIIVEQNLPTHAGGQEGLGDKDRGRFLLTKDP